MCIVDKSLVLERGEREAQLLVQLSFISIVQNPNNSCLKELRLLLLLDQFQCVMETQLALASK